MSEKFPDPNKPTVVRKLYSFYPVNVERLAALAKLAGISQSLVLRELIDVAYVERVLQKKETPDNYALETRKW